MNLTEVRIGIVPKRFTPILSLRGHPFEPVLGCLDAFVIIAVGIASTLLYHLAILHTSFSAIEINAYVVLSVLAALLFVLVGKATNGYRESLISEKLRIPKTLNRTLFIWCSIVAILGVSAFLLKVGKDFSRGSIIVFFLAGAVGLLVNRLIWRNLINFLIENEFVVLRRVLLLRSEIVEKPQTPSSWRFYDSDFRTSGYVLSHQMEVAFDDHDQVKRMIPRIAKMVSKNEISEIFVEIQGHKLNSLHQVIDSLSIFVVPVRLILDQFTQSLVSASLTQIGDHLAVEIQREPLTVVQRVAKRTLDLFVATSAIFTLFPLMLIVALAIKIESGGPVLFKQQRKGYAGKIFRIVKFRSMTVTEDGSNIKQAVRNDARVTKVGRFIRRTSIDELPQLWNVLMGDMSIVGPRPHALAHDEHYVKLIAKYPFRQHSKPGMTGLAQIRGHRGETPNVEDMEKRVEADNEYLENWSIWVDIYIILKTATVVLQQPKAF